MNSFETKIMKFGFVILLAKCHEWPKGFFGVEKEKCLMIINIDRLDK
jgi:hypothetical protein